MLTKMMCNSIASQLMKFKGTERLLDSTGKYFHIIFLKYFCSWKNIDPKPEFDFNND
jgi:hypothetical protein